MDSSPNLDWSIAVDEFEMKTGHKNSTNSMFYDHHNSTVENTKQVSIRVQTTIPSTVYLTTLDLLWFPNLLVIFPVGKTIGKISLVCAPNLLGFNKEL